MKKFIISALVLSGVFSMGVCQTAAAGPTTYTVVDLTTAGFQNSVANAVGGGQQGGFGYGASGSNTHALLWSGSSASVIDLNGGFTSSTINAVNSGQQAGSGNGHAMLWSGTAASAVDLNPITGFIGSVATSMSGGQQGGYGTLNGPGFYTHALLWNGTAASVIDLNGGFTTSAINAISGGQQGGTGDGQAMLWTGTAASAVDLNGNQYDRSEVFGVDGGKQAGYATGGTLGLRDHAILWSGTAASAVDLHPAGFQDSKALAMANGMEVGWADTHAIVWSGSAASAVDLQQFLPAKYIDSFAYGIDSSGDIVGYALDASENKHAFEWVPTPEPTSLALFALASIPLLARRRR